MAGVDRWLLVDTETTGLSQPIHAVEIAAQTMDGWTPIGEPFRKLINVEAEISTEVSRVHGYTKEILERDGFPPTAVYKQLFEYANGAPICSYNLKYDYDDVLFPEWRRLNFTTFLQQGFCLLRLTQRLIDPVLAGNHKLQTLRQFYRLPERGAHSALGDVQTVIDLLETVLRPLAAANGLHTVRQLKDLTEEIWFPTKIPFGKHRGRSFQDARQDTDLKSWIEWLAQSDTERSRAMGTWYLTRICLPDPKRGKEKKIIVNATDSAKSSSQRGAPRMGIIVFNDTKIKQLKAFVSAARERLADLEMALDRERVAVAKTQSDLFRLLKNSYKRRDSLTLLVEYRRIFISALMADFDLEPDDIITQFYARRERMNEEFDSAVKSSEAISSLSEGQQNELKDIYRKLVKLYHPDRVIFDSDKAKAYGALMAIINQAKASMDIDLMREIVNGPAAFMRKNNLGELDDQDEDEFDELFRLYESLQSRILEVIGNIDELRSGPEYEIFRLAARRPSFIYEVANKYMQDLEAECGRLDLEAQGLKSEIENLQNGEAF